MGSGPETSPCPPSKDSPRERRLQLRRPPPKHQIKLKFWLGFEAMEKITKEQGLDELFIDETIADRITRGISSKEAEKLDERKHFLPKSATNPIP